MEHRFRSAYPKKKEQSLQALKQLGEEEEGSEQLNRQKRQDVWITIPLSYREIKRRKEDNSDLPENYQILLTASPTGNSPRNF